MTLPDVSAFRHSSAVRIRAFFDAATVTWIRDQIDDLGGEAADTLAGHQPRGAFTAVTDRSRPSSNLIVVPEIGDSSVVCRYECILTARPAFRERILPLLLPVIEHLGGEPFLPFKDKVNNKYPGGGAYRPHQDIVAYRTFGPRYHLSAMIAIDAATVMNGCLRVADGYLAYSDSHPEAVADRVEGRAIFPWHQGGHLNGDIVDEVARELPWCSLEMNPCDLVVFDSFVPHYSERNSTTSPRRALFITFSRVREGDHYHRYYEAKRRSPLDPRFHVSTPSMHADWRSRPRAGRELLDLGAPTRSGEEG